MDYKKAICYVSALFVLGGCPIEMKEVKNKTEQQKSIDDLLPYEKEILGINMQTKKYPKQETIADKVDSYQKMPAKKIQPSEPIKRIPHLPTPQQIRAKRRKAARGYLSFKAEPDTFKSGKFYQGSDSWQIVLGKRFMLPLGNYQITIDPIKTMETLPISEEWIKRGIKPKQVEKTLVPERTCKAVVEDEEVTRIKIDDKKCK